MPAVQETVDTVRRIDVDQYNTWRENFGEMEGGGSGFDLVRGNAMKNLIVLIVTVAALAVFIINDQVRWGLGLLLASGNAAGAWVAAHMAMNRGAGFVRYVLIVIIALSAIALFTDYRLVS